MIIIAALIIYATMVELHKQAKAQYAAQKIAERRKKL